MEAIALSVLNNPCLSNPISLLLGETVCRLLPVVSCKTLSYNSKNSSSRAQTAYKGGSLSLGRGFSGRAFKEDFTSDKSSRKEKLIDLFKRIQIEISEGKSGSGIYSESTQASKDDDSSVEMSVLEFLQQSSRETKVESSRLKHREESNPKNQTSEENAISVPEPPSAKYTRPPSKFVRKSPIPLTTAFQSNEIEMNSKKELSSEADKESLKVEGMKLSELKELAKERGIKGYSKLKKSELVELLKS